MIDRWMDSLASFMNFIYGGFSTKMGGVKLYVGLYYFQRFFVAQDRAYEIVEDMESNKMRKMKKRICLVLDCLCAHDFSDKTADLINLQHYVIKEKRLSEREAIVIFYDVVRVVEALHKVSMKVPFSAQSQEMVPGLNF